MKLNHNDARQFPKLLKHLRNNFQDVLKKSSVLRGLEESGIDYKDALIYTSYGYDPLINVRVVLSGGGSGIGGWEQIETWSDGAAYGIQVPASLVKAFNKDEDLTTFSVAGNMRMIDAVLVIMLVGWRKTAEVSGLISKDEQIKAVKDFRRKAIGMPQSIFNPFG